MLKAHIPESTKIARDLFAYLGKLIIFFDNIDKNIIINTINIKPQIVKNN